LKWASEDIEWYNQSKEYIDTILMPLIPITFGEQMQNYAAQKEFITILSFELEKQLKGRVLLMPELIYLPESCDFLEIIKPWSTVYEQTAFQHIFWITADSAWKRYEKEMTGSVLWIPSIPLKQMAEKQAKEVMMDYVRQVGILLTEKWEN
jgi:hypothetical protein